MRTPSKRPGSLNKHKPKNKTEGNWDLPHPVELKQHQKDFLRSHYGPGINIESANLLAETKKIIKSSSSLTKNRFGDAEWLKSNYRLYEKALEGDEKSFQVLISRDPRYLCSDLGLLFISKWRSEINISYFTKRTKNALARLQSWIDKTGPENQWLFRFLVGSMQIKIELDDWFHPNMLTAQKQILQISSGLLRSFEEKDRRKSYGSNLPAYYVSSFYRASVILFSGLKRYIKVANLRTYREKIRRIDRRLEIISKIPDAKIRSDTKEGFLIYIRAVACLYLLQSKIEQKQILQRPSTKSGIDERVKFNANTIMKYSPARLAEKFVGELFGYKSRTIAKYASLPMMISWPSKNKIVATSKLIQRLEAYEPLRDILCTES